MIRSITTGALLITLVWTQDLLAHNGKVPVVIGDLPLTKLSERIYVVHGPQAFPSPETQGFMNNPGFVVTSAGAVVVDPGSSLQIGEKLLERIQTVTDKPVVAVFNTHVHGDHWLGNQAVQERYPNVDIYAHENMLKRIESGEGEEWIELFNRMTEGATAGTKVVAPTISLSGDEIITIGDTDFHIYHPEKAHSDTDLMIEVRREKSVFAGDILANRRVQSARPQDSDIMGQIDAVKYLLSTDNDIFIPGHGMSGGREVPQLELDFLQDLYTSVAKHYEAGLDSFEMKDQVKLEMAKYADWYNFDELGKIIDYVFLRVEQDAF